MSEFSEDEQRQIRRVWANLSVEFPELTIEQVAERYEKLKEFDVLEFWEKYGPECNRIPKESE